MSFTPSSRGSRPHADAVATELAGRQNGVFTRGQLLEAGVAVHLIDHRVRTRRFKSVHRGVYLIESLENEQTALMAACLACGPGAFVSHGSAAALWDLTFGEIGRGGPVDVAGTDLVRDRPGIRVHRCPSLRPADGTRRAGVPVTTPARTLIDLAAVVTDRELERAIAVARARDLVRPRALRAAMSRTRGKGGNEAPAAGARPAVRSYALAGRGAPALARPGGGASRTPVSTREWPGARSTSSGRRSGWSWRWTDSSTTGRETRSSATAGATDGWSSRGTVSSG